MHFFCVPVLWVASSGMNVGAAQADVDDDGRWCYIRIYDCSRRGLWCHPCLLLEVVPKIFSIVNKISSSAWIVRVV